MKLYAIIRPQPGREALLEASELDYGAPVQHHDPLPTDHILGQLCHTRGTRRPRAHEKNEEACFRQRTYC
eukprot:46487-Eustigmatos_ZCMA.PRE.1